MSEQKDKLDALIARRDKSREQLQLVRGRLEAARSELKDVEEECRKRGVDPSKLDAVIGQLGQRYDQAVLDLERRIGEAEKAITPFLEE